MIAVIDYGMGNLRSVQKGFERSGFVAEITRDCERIAAADGVVLPGVGAFHSCMENLRRFGLVEAVRDVVNSACQEGLSVSYHIAEDAFEDEIVGLVESEHIDLIVFSADNGPMEESLRKIMPRVSSRIIRVQEKDHVNYL